MAPIDSRLATIRAAAHPQAYHEAEFDRLRTATRGLEGDAYSTAFRAELGAIRTKAAATGSALHGLLVP